MEYLNQPLGELFSTAPSKIIAGLILWYLTAGIWWTRSWAVGLSSQELKRNNSDAIYGFAPLVFVFSIVAMPVYYLLKGIGFVWYGVTMLLMGKETRQRFEEINK